MDWIVAVVSILVLWLMGNKYKYAPIIGALSQILWINYAISLKQYGLLTCTIVYLIIHIRNSIKWWRE